MFRSKNMTLNRIMFAKECTWETMNYLANSELVMINPHQKNMEMEKKNETIIYAGKMIKRCEEAQEKIGFIKNKLIEFGWPITKLKKSVAEYIKQIDDYRKENLIEGEELFIKEETLLKNNYEILNDHLNNYESIIKQRINFLEIQRSASVVEELIPIDFYGNFQDEKLNHKKFHFNIGLIPTVKVMPLQKILFRISRENIVMKTKNLKTITDPFLKKKDIEEKTLIFLLFPKTEKEYIIDKVNKLLSQFSFSEIQYIKPQEKNSNLIILEKNLKDNEKILIETKYKVNEILQSFAVPDKIDRLSQIHYLNIIINRERAFVKNIVFIEEKDGFNILELWIAKDNQEQVTNGLSDIKFDDLTFIQPKIEEINFTSQTPPTLFGENEFTKTFQLVVDTYGVPRYKEANPGLFTIVSFPFLFGVMFGDIGHGLILFCFGLYCMFGISNKNNFLYELKYIISMMGFFAIFCGFIYNEFFSVPFAIQPSCYEKVKDKFVLKEKDCTYGFGTDWVWAESSNETSFVNSFKMKFSIIVGVSQMLLGIFLKGLNAIHFKKYYDLWFEALPQIIFMSLTFGYMSFCIIIKWLTNWENKEAISIIQLFINFITVKDSLFSTPEFQQNLQIIFVLICFLCIFLMLVPKPLLIFYKQKKEEKLVLTHDEEINENLMPLKEKEQKDEHKEEEGFGELVVHQMIETIEFVLGSVSNTASYLRLWALSLAHGQLAKVFLDMIFGWSFKNSESFLSTTFVIIIGFMFFFCVTFAVILIMDTMECFLHALRLHWVEFQNKFFKGDGISFHPFKHELVE
jgi:V-type H+-transporting ATPase subunit a